MKTTDELVYPAPLETVRAMLLDPAYRERVLEAQHVVRGTVEITEDGDVTTVVVEQAQSTESVPSFVRKLTGDEITITVTERWTSRERAEVSSTVPGAPGAVTGTNVLVREGEQTRLVVTREVSVKVPLVGGKIATYVAGMHTKALAKEDAVARAWLAGA